MSASARPHAAPPKPSERPPTSSAESGPWSGELHVEARGSTRDRREEDERAMRELSPDERLTGWLHTGLGLEVG